MVIPSTYLTLLPAYADGMAWMIKKVLASGTYERLNFLVAYRQ